MTRTGWIYALYDLRVPSKIRYVGQTRSRRGLNDRIYHHKWAAKNNPKVPVLKWIAEIGGENLGYFCVSQCEVSDLDAEEVYQISAYRFQGGADLNVLDGGTGFSSRNSEGENNSKASLNWRIVNDIRERACTTYVSVSKESSNLGITPAGLSKVLLNQSWYDPEYNPQSRITIKQTNNSEDGSPVWRSFSNSEVEDIRGGYLFSGYSIQTLATKWGAGVTSIRRVLFDLYGSEESRAACIEKRGPIRSVNKMTSEQIELIKSLKTSGMSQSAIGSMVGCTQSRVSQILRKVE